MKKMKLWMLMLAMVLSILGIVAETDVAYANTSSTEVGTPQFDIPSGLYGYVDGNGNWLIKPKFLNAKPFHGGLAAVSDGYGKELWGYINPDGSYVIEPQFRGAYNFLNDKAVVYMEGLDGSLPRVIDRDGNITLELEYHIYDANVTGGHYLAVITDVHPSKGGEKRKFGIITKTGEVIKPQFDGMPNVMGGVVSFYIEGASESYYDRDHYIALDNGNVKRIKGPIRRASEGVGIIEYDAERVMKRPGLNKLYAYVFSDGTIIDSYKGTNGIEYPFVEACLFSEGLACAAINRTEFSDPYEDRWGFLQKDGTWLNTPEYTLAGSFQDGVAPVKLNVSWGYMNTDGSWFIKPESLETPESVPAAFNFDTVFLFYKQDEIDYVYREAQEIVNKLINGSMSDYEKTQKIYEFVTSTVEYDHENFNSNNIPRVSATAYGALKYNLAVCEGYSELVSVLLNLAGVENQIIIGTITDTGVGHAWNLVNIDGVMYHMDATWDEGSNKWDYFLKSDTYMKKSRTWNEAYYPSASRDY